MELKSRRYDVGVKYGLFQAQLALALSGKDRDMVLSRISRELSAREKRIRRMTLVEIIRSSDPAIRNRSVDEFAQAASTHDLLTECAQLENSGEKTTIYMSAYGRCSSCTPFIAFICRRARELQTAGLIPFEATSHLLRRRFEEACEALRRAEKIKGLNPALASAYAAAYKGLAFKTLADQVRRSVRSVRGNQWMSRIGHPTDYPFSIRPELLKRDSTDRPIRFSKNPPRAHGSHAQRLERHLFPRHGLSRKAPRSSTFPLTLPCVAI